MTLQSPQTRPALTRQWGAEPTRAGLWRFSFWAPGARHVMVDVAGRRTPLVLRGDGFHRATATACAGEPYSFIVDGRALPDPASRMQAGLVDGPSVLVDPDAHLWQSPWTGRPWDEAVVLQVHVGTFTPEGTFDAAAARMEGLAATGITAIQLMPVTHFPGTRGWGYDGGLPFAPHPALGTADALRGMVDAAHRAGIMVLLDLAWTSFRQGRAGVGRAMPSLFDPQGGLDLSCIPARSFLIENALHWLVEYRMDGLRIDRPDRLDDPLAPNILTELAARLHAAGFTRPTHLIAGENPPRPERFGAVWRGEWQRAIEGVLTAEYGRDALVDLCRVLAEPRPALPLAHAAHVHFNQSHASIGARPFGERLIRLADPRAVQVAHALLLSAPAIPMLFMGDEVGERAPFHIFADLTGDEAQTLRSTRRALFDAMPDMADLMPDPMDRSTFALSRPYRRDGPDAAGWHSLTAGLLRFRAAGIVPLLRSGPAAPPEARPTGPASLLASWPCKAGTLHLAANFGAPPDDEPPVFLRPPKLALCHVARDPHAFALWLEKPRRS